MSTDPLVRVIATAAVRQAVTHAEQIQSALPEGAKPELPAQVRAKAERLVTQDPASSSWRVWGAFWSGLTAVLILPDVQQGITAAIGQVLPPEYLPIASAILGVIWPLVSKLRDPRPVRGAPSTPPV